MRRMMLWTGMACLALLAVASIAAADGTPADRKAAVATFSMDEDTTMVMDVTMLLPPGYVSYSVRPVFDATLTVDPANGTIVVVPDADWSGVLKTSVIGFYEVYPIDPPLNPDAPMDIIIDEVPVEVTVIDMPDILVDIKTSSWYDLYSIFPEGWDAVWGENDGPMPWLLDGASLVYGPLAYPAETNITLTVEYLEGVSAMPGYPLVETLTHIVHITSEAIPETTTDEDVPISVSLAGYFPSSPNDGVAEGQPGDGIALDIGSMTLTVYPEADAFGWRNATVSLSYPDGIIRTHRVEIFVEDMPDIAIDGDWEEGSINVSEWFGISAIPSTVLTDDPISVWLDPASGVVGFRGAPGARGSCLVTVSSLIQYLSAVPPVTTGIVTHTFEVILTDYPRVRLDEDSAGTATLSEYFSPGWDLIEIVADSCDCVATVTPGGMVTILPASNATGYWNATAIARYLYDIDPPKDDAICDAGGTEDHRFSVLCFHSDRAGISDHRSDGLLRGRLRRDPV